jgi:hypothetical protein
MSIIGRAFVCVGVAVVVITATLLILRFVAKFPYDSLAMQWIPLVLGLTALLVGGYLTKPETEDWRPRTTEHWRMIAYMAVGLAAGLLVAYVIPAILRTVGL